MPKTSVHLVTWNGAKYIPYLFASLRAQSYSDWELLVIDNNSSDDTVARVEKEFLNFPVSARLIGNARNKGFAGGHNQALRETRGDYVVVLNQDMYLAPDCFKNLVGCLDAQAEAGAVAPRLMRWNFAAVATGGLAASLTTEIDALGLRVFRNRRVVEQAAGSSWPAIQKKLRSLETTRPVFGVSGALALFRRAAIQKISYPNGEFFDESFFMYKEDVDVAFRLARAGFGSFVALDAVAYHDRTGAGPGSFSDWAAAANKQKHNETVRYYSYKNHLKTLFKNEYWQNFIIDFPWIFWYELKKFIYFLVFDRAALRGLAAAWGERADLTKKRRAAAPGRVAGWRDPRRWWRPF